jgi:PAS domain-containing protein
LKITQEKCPDVPFIFVSGTLGEEVAIEALKIGATDYVLKERLSRIAPSVQRALREAKERTERKLAEEALRRSEAYLAEAQRLSHTGSWAFNVATRQIVHWSQEHFRIFGFDPHQGIPSFDTFRQRVLRTIKPGPPTSSRQQSARGRTTNWIAESFFPTAR